jgi:hypothetical protein
MLLYGSCSSEIDSTLWGGGGVSRTSLRAVSVQEIFVAFLIWSMVRSEKYVSK